MPRLPVGCDPVAEVGLVARVLPPRGNELLERHPVPDARRPAVELFAESLEVVRHPRLDAEVDQSEPVGRAALDLGDRVVPRLEVDVGRRSNREDAARRLDPDAARVAREDRPLVEVEDVV